MIFIRGNDPQDHDWILMWSEITRHKQYNIERYKLEESYRRKNLSFEVWREALLNVRIAE